MRTKELIYLVIGVALFSIANFRTSLAQSYDIEACVINQWGSDLKPIKIFDQDVSVGDTVRAPLCKAQDCTGLPPRDWWDDFMPTYYQCPGYGYIRDADASIISRITPGGPNERAIIFVRHAGGRGYYPGSEGYVKILNPQWKITRIIASSDMMHDFYGSGVSIDRENGIITWLGRGGCSSCACQENRTVIAVMVEKTDTPCKSQGDVNGDDVLTVADVVYTINYLFKGGPPAKCPSLEQ